MTKKLTDAQKAKNAAARAKGKKAAGKAAKSGKSKTKALPIVATAEEKLQDQVDVAEALREATVGVRFRRFVFGVERKLNEQQRNVMAAAFDAADRSVKGRKVLLDTKRKEYRSVVGRVLAAMGYWREVTVPFEDVGVRLIKRDKIEEFEKRLAVIQKELDSALVDLDAVYADAREQAKASLGNLFDEQDYPDSLKKFFGFSWDYPSIEPAAALKKIAPAIYEAQQKVIAAKFATAVVDAEAMLAAEMHKMLSGWIDRLTPGVDGKKKVIRKDALEGFKEVLARVKEMAPAGGSSVLAQAVKQAEQLAAGIDIGKLKNDGIAQSALKEQIEAIGKSIEVLAVDAEERAILLED